MSVVLFAFDSSRQALVFARPDTGQPVGISSAALRDAGWTFNDDDARRSLPRFEHPADQPRIIVPGGRR